MDITAKYTQSIIIQHKYDEHPIDAIFIPDRLRKISENSVSALIDSIRTIGLQTPITVRFAKSINDDGVVLVSGRHRLEACKRLGADAINCLMFNGTDVEAELWEIAENLHRSDLTVLERADHTARWVALTEGKLAQLAPVSGRGRIEGRGNEGGLRAAAREFGIDRTQAQRAIKIADLPIPAKEAARQAGLDNNQKALLRLVKSSDPIEEVNNITEERKKHQSPTKKSPLSIIQNTWLNASQSERSEIVIWIMKQHKQYA